MLDARDAGSPQSDQKRFVHTAFQFSRITVKIDLDLHSAITFLKTAKRADLNLPVGKCIDHRLDVIHQWI
jgi:succinylglutamate desuccinylase